MSAWDWLRAELERRLGEDEAAALWREYWRHYKADSEARRIREMQRRARQGSAAARRYLDRKGISYEESK